MFVRDEPLLVGRGEVRGAMVKGERERTSIVMLIIYLLFSFFLSSCQTLQYVKRL